VSASHSKPRRKSGVSLQDDGDSDASDANRAFSEKCSNNPFMRKFLQKTQNCVTCVTVKTVETGKTAVVTKLTDKTGSCQNSLAVKTGNFASFDNGGTRSSGISGIKTAFSEKCSDSSFTRKVLQKPRNDATNATVKTVETGKTAVVTKLTLTKLVVKTGSRKKFSRSVDNY